ncbi:MAG: branched-chain amino acid ABC transporter permease [Oscillospiraceae bacterium]|nr:branched-chain amino acid ABC transporter permease [Oscillospiraceae bacterium]
MSGNRRAYFKRTLLNTCLCLAFFAAVNYMIGARILNRYYTNILNLVLIYVVAAVSLNLTCGYLGQLPLGHAGFMSLGGYTAAIITTRFSIPDIGPVPGQAVLFFLATVAGGIVAMIAGVLIGLPALRLKGDYLAIITLAFGEIIRVLVQNIKITGGAMGMGGIGKYTDFSWGFFWTVMVVAFTFLLVNSRHGRAIKSVREDEIAAESVGINLTYYKIVAFAGAAFFAGVSGSLFAHHICYLEPGNFGYNMSIEMLVMVVLGGLGSISGSIIAATVLTIVPEVLQTFATWKMIIYSLLLVVVMIFKPSGLMGDFEFSAARLIRKIFRRKEDAPQLPENYTEGEETDEQET